MQSLFLFALFIVILCTKIIIINIFVKVSCENMYNKKNKKVCKKCHVNENEVFVVLVVAGC